MTDTYPTFVVYFLTITGSSGCLLQYLTSGGTCDSFPGVCIVVITFARVNDIERMPSNMTQFYILNLPLLFCSVEPKAPGVGDGGL